MPSNVYSLFGGWSCWFKSAIPPDSEHSQPYECDTIVRLENGNDLATNTVPYCNGGSYVSSDNRYTTGDNSTFNIACGQVYGGAPVVSLWYRGELLPWPSALRFAQNTEKLAGPPTMFHQCFSLYLTLASWLRVHRFRSQVWVMAPFA